MNFAPTKITEDVRQMLALRGLRESIAPTDQPVSLTYLRRGDADLLEQIDKRVIKLQAEIRAKRVLG